LWENCLVPDSMPFPGLKSAPFTSLLLEHISLLSLYSRCYFLHKPYLVLVAWMDGIV
jgi:hypothetical protein